MSKQKKLPASWHLRRLADQSFEIYTRSTGLVEVGVGALEFRTTETVIYRAEKTNKQLAAYCQQAGSDVEIEPLKITTINRLPF